MSYEHITKIEQKMQRLAKRMKRQIAQMSTGGAKVLQQLEEERRTAQTKLSQNKVQIDHIMKTILDTHKQKFTYYPEVVPDIVLHDLTLKCNDKKIMEPAQYSKQCKTKRSWFSKKTTCRMV
jgi:hypothetical protein